MSEQERIVAAFTRLSPQYEQEIDRELNNFWGWSYRDFVSQLVQGIELHDGDRLLDIATGTGAVPIALHERSRADLEMVGLDITPSLLAKARSKMRALDAVPSLSLVCGSALSMPYSRRAFTVVICALATHHMQVSVLVSEIARVINAPGRLTIADVSASDYWKLPLVKKLLRFAAFLYFLLKDGYSRASIEAAAVENILTAQEWVDILEAQGFANVQMTKLPRRWALVPSPLVIHAVFPAG